MKKVLKATIMATFVAATLSGCVEQEDRVEVLSARNVDECVANGMEQEYCQMQYEKAAAMHEEVAPKFETQNECGTQFGDSCVRHEVRQADGTMTSMWMPMMMGYMMGNMSSNIAHSAATARPLYMSDAKRDRDGSYRGSMVTASGNSASFGKHSLSRSAAMSVPKAASVASTRAAVSTRGGFSASARGSSAS